MAVKWVGTKYKGVRYYKHPIRKHGVNKDRYFAIRYQKEGKRIEEGIGWASELDPKDKKNWTVEKVAIVLAELKEAAKGLKEGPSRLSEKRAIAEEKSRKEKAEAELQKIASLSFKEIFGDHYFPIARQNKTKQAWLTEESLFKLWIEPVIGNLPLKDISPIHLERIKKNMADAGKSPRSVAYALSVIRQLYNFTKNIGLYFRECPVHKVKIPRQDNRRQRFLSHEEADTLLNALQEKSPILHDMALLSLHCGLRAGEVFSLTWADIDIEQGSIFIRNPKNGRNRYAYMTDAVKNMLSNRKAVKDSELVFPSRNGVRIDRASKTFDRIVEELGFNKGITDTRQKVVWHSLRHTFASWLAQDGVNLYVIKELLGHSQISMTERYSHLQQGTLQDAVKILERGITTAGQKEAGQVMNCTK